MDDNCLRIIFENLRQRGASKNEIVSIGQIVLSFTLPIPSKNQDYDINVQSRVATCSLERPSQEAQWIDRQIMALAILVPKKIREPFLGDLQEDLQELRNNGASSWKACRVALTQIFIAVICNARIWKIGIVGGLLASIRKWFA